MFATRVCSDRELDRRRLRPTVGDRKAAKGDRVTAGTLVGEFLDPDSWLCEGDAMVRLPPDLISIKATFCSSVADEDGMWLGREVVPLR